MAATTDRLLVVNADDFGLTEGINRGVLEAYEAGALASASLMATMPAFDDAVRRARAAGDGFGVGLHLTLTLGRPLTSAPSLIDGETGEFLSHGRFVRRALARRISTREVAEECATQLARCLAAGVRVTHVDSHHHVHTLPSVCAAVESVARDQGIPFVRRTAEPLRSAVLPWRRIPQRLALRVLSLDARGSTPHGLRIRFAGPSLLGARNFEGALLRFLDRLPPGVTELMVHPGHVDGALPFGDRYIEARERELGALLSPRTLGRLCGGAIRVVHFGQLGLDAP